MLLSTQPPTPLTPSGGGVSGGGGGWGSAGFLDSLQAAVIQPDRVSVQAAATGDDIWYCYRWYKYGD